MGDDFVVSSVSLKYPRGPLVLKDVSLTIPAGSRCALLGSNGSGKTTLLRALCGSHIPESGSIALGTMTLKHDAKSLRTWRSAVQLVLQDPDDQLFSADVQQDISFGPTNLGLPREEIFRRVDEALDLLAIQHLKDRPCHQLSYGERKRVAIAGAVAMRPSVLLLDEPTAGLDPAATEEVVVVLEKLHEMGTTVVLSTHDVDFAYAHTDQACVVTKNPGVGGRVTVGGVESIFSDAELLAGARLSQPWAMAIARAAQWNDRPRTLESVLAHF